MKYELQYWPAAGATSDFGPIILPALKFFSEVAEEEGFEPPVRLPPRLISSQVP